MHISATLARVGRATDPYPGMLRSVVTESDRKYSRSRGPAPRRENLQPLITTTFINHDIGSCHPTGRLPSRRSCRSDDGCPAHSCGFNRSGLAASPGTTSGLGNARWDSSRITAFGRSTASAIAWSTRDGGVASWCAASAAVAVRGRLPGTRRSSGRGGPGLRIGVGRLGHRHEATDLQPDHQPRPVQGVFGKSALIRRVNPPGPRTAVRALWLRFASCDLHDEASAVTLTRSNRTSVSGNRTSSSERTPVIENFPAGTFPHSTTDLRLHGSPARARFSERIIVMAWAGRLSPSRARSR